MVRLLQSRDVPAMRMSCVWQELSCGKMRNRCGQRIRSFLKESCGCCRKSGMRLKSGNHLKSAIRLTSRARQSLNGMIRHRVAVRMLQQELLQGLSQQGRLKPV